MTRLIPTTCKAAFFAGFTAALTVGLLLSAGDAWRMGGRPLLGNDGYDGYFEIAAGVARGQGFTFYPDGPVALHRPPLVPVLLAPLTLLPEVLHRPGVVLLHSLVFGAACWLLFDLASRLFDRRVAGYSLLILAAYPWIYWHVKNPINNICQLAAVLLLINLLSRELTPTSASRKASSWLVRSVALGLACAAAVLTHGTMLLSVPLLLLVACCLLIKQREYQRVTMICSALAVMCCAIAPWTYRNYRVAGRFIPVVSGAGLHYFFGNAHWRLIPHAEHDESSWEQTLALFEVHGPKSEVLAFGGWRDASRNQESDQRMIDDVLSDPGRFAKKVALSAVEFYFPSIHCATVGHRPGRRRAALENAALSLWHFAMWLLAMVAFRRLQDSAQRKYVGALVGCTVILVVPYLPFVACIEHGRYVVHTLPLAALAAAVGVASRREGQRIRTAVPRSAIRWSELRGSVDVPFLIYRYRYLCCFAGIGFLSILLELAIIRLVHPLGRPPASTAVFAFAVGMVFSFVLNAVFNFRVPRRQIVRTFAWFAAISAISFALNMAVVSAFFSLLGDRFGAVRLGSAGLLFLIGYSLHRRFTFDMARNFGLAVYANAAEDPQLVYDRVGRHCDHLHLDLIDETMATSPSQVKLENIAAARRLWRGMPTALHLMSKRPKKWVGHVWEHVDWLLFHTESEDDLMDLIFECRHRGKKVGVVWRPQTPWGELTPFLPHVDFVMVLGIREPGKSGQTICPEAMKVAATLDRMRPRYGYDVMFDGGVKTENVAEIPARYIVAASAVIKADNPVHAANVLRTGAKYCEAA